MKHIAIIGATGAVGRQMLSDLEDITPEDFDVSVFASPRSEGEALRFRDKKLKTQSFSLQKMSGFDYILMSAGSQLSLSVAEEILKVNPKTVIIDNSSAWRLHDSIPLIVPEVNWHTLTGFEGGIIANPNCSTIELVVALAPLAKAFGLKKVIVSTYQSVSGSGQKGIRELGDQIEAGVRFQKLEPKVYREQIAFNVINQIGEIDSDSSYAEEERKMILETRKILEQPDLSIIATAARVPVFHCHAESVTVELARPVNKDEASKVLASAPGLRMDEDSSPISMEGKADVTLSRLRLAPFEKTSSWLSFWLVADNLRKGAATNATQIMHGLMKRGKI